ncbi:hypothetical protein C8J56DRAFT_825747 [Mycena floridula]|nr:hypothetical protein C8J56DRAFT_825747 [Mycena floridula]
MAPSEETVLITGVNGFVGSHLATQLLAEGYTVRGTARGSKFDEVKAAEISKNPRFQLIQMDDIPGGDFTEALKGVTAVMHVAAPLAGKASAEDGHKIGVQGALNVIEQAYKAGITKIVVTASWGSTMDPNLSKMLQGGVVSRKDWGVVSKEELLSGAKNPLWNYLATKILAEAAVWDFAKEHPSLDLASINPPFIYGPPAPGFKYERTRLGSNNMLYSLVAGAPGRDLYPQYCPFYTDVRDVARAHIRCLKAPKVSGDPQQKRFLLSAGHFTWKQAAEYLEKARPDLKDRLPSTANAKPFPVESLCTNDLTPAIELLGFTEYISWEKMITDSLDALLAAEKDPNWKITL